MRFFTARRLALAAVLPVLFTFTIIPGCSEESEGERCGDMTGPNSSDCQTGLTCTQIDPSNSIFRCCNPNRVTNSRCVPVSNNGAVGEAGSAGETGSAGSAGETSGPSDTGGSGGTGGASAGTGGASAGTGGDTGGASAGDSSALTEAGAGGAH